MSKPIRAQERRYTYCGKGLDSWFHAVPLEFPGHDSIWSLATADDGVIYIGLAGEHNKGTTALLAYSPKSGKVRIVADSAVLIGDMLPKGRMPHSKIHFAICPVGRKIWFATHVSGAVNSDDIIGPMGHGPIADPMTGYEGGRLMCYDSVTGKTEGFGVIVANEGIRCLQMSADGRVAYGITYPKHRFFMHDLATRETYISSRVGRYGGIDLFMDPRGVVWGAHDGFEGTEPGQFYRFAPATRRLVDVDAFLPRSTAGRMTFPELGAHVLHMTPTPDGQAMVSCYGESRIALFDPRRLRVWDWGTVWEKAPGRKVKPAKPGAEKGIPSSRLITKPHFAWCPAFDVFTPRTVAGARYDRFVWYGEEQWEYERHVRLCAVAYNRRDPGRIVKIRFGTPKNDGFPSGHWAASTVGADGRVYFAERVRAQDTPDDRLRLRLSVFTPPKEIGELAEAPTP